MIINKNHNLVKTSCEKLEKFASANKLEHNLEDLCLQLWISKERHNITNSKFQNFVAFLPIYLNNFPILYTNKEMKLLKHSFLEEVITSERKYLEEDYKILKEKAPEIIGNISQKEFNESYEIFYSRTYQYKNKAGQNVTGFVPLVDLFNYKTGNSDKVGWKYDSSTNNFIVYAIDNIKKGSRVIIILINLASH